MKRFFTVSILWTWACLALAGCGGRGGALRVGMDATYRPFEFVGEDGQITGVSVEIGRRIAAELGREVVFENIQFDGLVTALKTGAIDLIISSMTATPERRKSLLFSEPYVRTGLSVLVAADSPLQAAGDLTAPGRRLVVRIGTTGESWCAEHCKDAVLVRLDSDAACVLEVINGTVDGWVYDQISVLNHHRQHPRRTRAILEPLRVEQWAVGMRPSEQAETVQAVNRALAGMRADGTFSALAERFLGAEKEFMKSNGLPFVFDLDDETAAGAGEP
jgi:ABC-type amino acid transport substrate-binding protein